MRNTSTNNLEKKKSDGHQTWGTTKNERTTHYWINQPTAEIYHYTIFPVVSSKRSWWDDGTWSRRRWTCREVRNATNSSILTGANEPKGLGWDEGKNAFLFFHLSTHKRISCNEPRRKEVSKWSCTMKQWSCLSWIVLTAVFSKMGLNCWFCFVMATHGVILSINLFAQKKSADDVSLTARPQCHRHHHRQLALLLQHHHWHPKQCHDQKW